MGHPVYHIIVLWKFILSSLTYLLCKKNYKSSMSLSLSSISVSSIGSPKSESKISDDAFINSLEAALISDKAVSSDDV